MNIVKEDNERPDTAKLAPADFEARALDIAADALADIRECDESRIYIKWQTLAGKTVPLLYVLFRGTGKLEKLPRVHVDEFGMQPAHAICLATMPSGTLMNPRMIRDAVRRGVEDHLLKFDIRHANPITSRKIAHA